MKTRIAVLFGGMSVEHEVSIISGIQALMSLDKEKYEVTPVYLTKKNEMYIGENIANIEKYKNIDALVKESTRVIMVNENNQVYLMSYPFSFFSKKKVEIDLVFPVVHGTNVEDGALQGYLKTIGIPFVGCDVEAAASGMNKHISKTILKDVGVPVIDGKCYTLSDYAEISTMVAGVENTLGYPVIVKPVNLGSSVGINIAKNQEDLISAIDDAFSYTNKVLIEHAIMNLREINCAVLGDCNEAIASECEEPMHTDEILSYEDKYVNNAKGSGSKGMASVARKIPAEITDEMKTMVQELAVKSFKTLNCNGVARIDFILDADTNQIYFNEINTIPGSLSFYLWEPIGVQYPELLERMIQLSLKRTREEKNLTFSFDTNILNQNSLSGVKGGKVGCAKR